MIERLSTRRICKKCGTVYNVRFLKPKAEGICDKCGGELYQRADDTAEVIKQRLEVYLNQTKPLVEFYRQKKVPFIESKTESLDSSPDLMVKKIIEELKKQKFI
jgi:adenylate kinase